MLAFHFPTHRTRNQPLTAEFLLRSENKHNGGTKHACPNCDDRPPAETKISHQTSPHSDRLPPRWKKTKKLQNLGVTNQRNLRPTPPHSHINESRSQSRRPPPKHHLPPIVCFWETAIQPVPLTLLLWKISDCQGVETYLSHRHLTTRVPASPSASLSVCHLLRASFHTYNTSPMNF